MKASLKTLIALSLLSGTVVAGSASADFGRGQPGYGGYDGRAPQQFEHKDGPDFRHDARPDYRFNDWRVARHVDQMQAGQRQRILQGLRSGQLTQNEADRLLQEQQDIERLQRKYMRDARLAPHERQRLMSELEEASRNIWRERHDAQTGYAPWFAWR